MLLAVLILAAVLVVLVPIICIYDMTHFCVVHYSICDKKIKKEIRFAVVSDLHNNRFGEHNEELLAAIEREKPDAILISGDMVTKGIDQRYEGAVSLLEGLCSKYPIYYAPGNHETKIEKYADYFGDSYECYCKELERLNISMMRNEKISLAEENVDIYGLELSLDAFGHFKPGACSTGQVKFLLGNPEDSSFNLLIAHNPEHFKYYAEWGCDLAIAGHQHGGIVRLPLIGGLISTSGLLFPKYDGGYFTKGKGKMIISRGLGTHTIPVRFNNRCELVILDLKKGM